MDFCWVRGDRDWLHMSLVAVQCPPGRGEETGWEKWRHRIGCNGLHMGSRLGPGLLAMQTPFYGFFSCLFVSLIRLWGRLEGRDQILLVYLCLASITTSDVSAQKLQNVSKAYSRHVLIIPEHETPLTHRCPTPTLLPSRGPRLLTYILLRAFLGMHLVNASVCERRKYSV